ncbi:major facilitator superfamily domain-containing protein [Lipomyces tetrasporus]
MAAADTATLDARTPPATEVDAPAIEAQDEGDPSDIYVGVISTDPEARPPVFKSTVHELVCVLMLAFAPAMNSAGQGSLQLALPTISKYFEIQGAALSWTITSYSLVTGSTILLMARLADILGRKRVLLISYGWYAVFALIQGFIKNDIAFDSMRGLQAFAGAAGPPAAVGILGVIYPAGRRKNKAMAAFAAGAPLGFIMGIVTSGICTEFLGWKAILLFFAIVYGTFAIAGIFVFPSDEVSFAIANRIVKATGGQGLVPVKRDWTTNLMLLENLDYVGAVLSTVGLMLFIFALAESGGAPSGWGTPYIIAILIVGILIVGLFVAWEFYVKNPLMPMFIWKYPGFALCMLLVLCGWMNFQGVLIYFTSLSMQNIRKYSPILTTAAMLPQATTGIVVNIVAAFVMHIIPGRILMIIAMCAFMTSALLWALQPLHITYWAMTLPALMTLVVGADLAYNVGNQFSLSIVPPNLKSTAAGIFNVTTQLAASIGIAASTAIVTSQIGIDIDGQPPEILHRGYRCAYWFAVGVAGVGIIGSLFLKVGTQGAKGQTDNGEGKPASVTAGAEQKETIGDEEQNHTSFAEDRIVNSDIAAANDVVESKEKL